MGEVEAAHLRWLGYEVRLDEPYQHYQFAGRADLVAIHREQRTLLHLENRTRFPDVQAFAGAYNGKRAYPGPDLARRLGIARAFVSETHVVVALWSAEALHTMRLREESFRSVSPDSPRLVRSLVGGIATEGWSADEQPRDLRPTARPAEHASPMNRLGPAAVGRAALPRVRRCPHRDASR